MQREILAHQEEQSLPKDLHEGGGQEVAASGYGATKNVESTCSGDPTERLKLRRQMAAAEGKKSTIQRRCLCSWKPLALKWKKSSQLRLLRLWQKEFGSANGTQNKKKHG